MIERYAGAMVASLLVACLQSGCGSDVRTPGSGGDGVGGGDTDLDLKCYDACIDKGESAGVCEEACTYTGTGAKGTGGKGTGGNGIGGKGTGGDTTGTGAGGTVDVEFEKSCVQCWEDNQGGPCGDVLKTCQNSLACTQLRNCPFSCVDKSDCLDECNDIIPSGVEPLTDLVQCMACNSGPCAADCEDSVFLSYCE